MSAQDQQVHTGDAEDAENDKANRAEPDAGIFKGVRHGQYTSSNVPLQQVDDCITVSATQKKKYEGQRSSPVNSSDTESRHICFLQDGVFKLIRISFYFILAWLLTE